MFSRLVIAFAVVTVLAGCGLKIGEGPNQDVAVKMGSAETTCLSGAAKTLGDYFRGGTSDRQISDLYSCVSHSLELFEERTWGQTPGEYKPGELRRFLLEYFLQGFTVSDSLLAEVMQLKRTLLGGSTEELTIEELHRLRQLMEILRVQSIRLRPYLPLTPEHTQNLSRKDLEESISALKDAANAIGQVLEDRSTPYLLSNLENLLWEVEKFLKEDQYKKDIADLRKLIPVAREMKKIFVSPDGTTMQGSDWRVLLTTGADLYSIMLRYSHTIHNQSTLLTGPGREEMADATEDAYHQIERVFDRNPNGTISYCNLYQLIDQVFDRFAKKQRLDELIQNKFAGYPVFLRQFVDPASVPHPDPKGVDHYLTYFQYGNYKIYRGTIEKFIQPLVQRYLKSMDPNDVVTHEINGTPFNFWDACSDQPLLADSKIPAKDLGLRKENLYRFWEGIQLFSEGQNFLERAFNWAGNFYGYGDPLDHSYLPQDLLGWKTLSDLFGVPESTLPPETQFASRSMANIILTHRPMFAAHDTQIVFNGSGTGLDNLSGLTELNLFDELVRLAWIAYSTDGKAWKGAHGGMTEPQLEDFYEDVKELGMSIYIFDPYGVDVAKKRFMEASLFTYSSDGNDKMSADEAIDYVAFLYSAKILSGKTYDIVKAQCSKWFEGCPSGSSKQSCHIGPKDLFEKEKVSTACFHQMAFDTYFDQLWDHMPGLRGYYASLPTRAGAAADSNKIYRETFRCLAEAVARPVDADANWIDSGDIDQLAALYHYLEAVYVRFDTDRSWTISKDEALVAYPVFGPILKKTAHDMGITFLSSDEDFQAVLTHILATGKIPSTSDWANLVEFGIRRYIISTNFEADRGRLLQVMGMITGRDTSSCFR